LLPSIFCGEEYGRYPTAWASFRAIQLRNATARASLIGLLDLAACFSP
jgi:hypothetical protein